MRNIDTPIDNENPAKTEYYSYYTNKINEFPIGSKIKFNAYKYNEVLTTEVYKINLQLWLSMNLKPVILFT